MADDVTTLMAKDDTRAGESALLFTAFEPSGDAHAAPVIRALLARHPELHIVAMGGPKMEAAGAEIIERTADDGAMGLNSFSRISAVRAQIRTLKAWLATHDVAAHVAVDSPAANFPICKIMRKQGAKVIHLVAPQIWAWGPWRIGKLRRLTDMVLCLLPFEEQWFTERGVPAKFIGHPVMNCGTPMGEIPEHSWPLPGGSPKIAIFPGSRSSEVRANLQLLADAFIEIKKRHGDASGVIVAANEELLKRIGAILKELPTGLRPVCGESDAAVAWCDIALTVSGTMSLDIARQHKPMVGVYKTGLVSWLGAKLVLQTPYRLLPNIIAGREICPEFIPHIGGCAAIVREALHLLENVERLRLQQSALEQVCAQFAGPDPAGEAATAICETCFMPGQS